MNVLAPDRNSARHSTDHAAAGPQHRSDVKSVVVNDPMSRREVPKPMRLGEILQRRRLISADKLRYALQQQALLGRHSLKLGEVLVICGLITPEEVNQALTEQTWRRQGFWVID